MFWKKNRIQSHHKAVSDISDFLCFFKDVSLHPRCFVSFQTVHFVGLGQMLHKSLPAQRARQEWEWIIVF